MLTRVSNFTTYICFTIVILRFSSNRSLKKRKDILETRAVLMEISMLSWNLPSGPKRRGSLL